MTTGREISPVEEEDGWWSAVDEGTGVASQGETREVALENLGEAVEATREARDDDTPAPEPEVLAGAVAGGDEETAERMREAIERRRTTGREWRR